MPDKTLLLMTSQKVKSVNWVVNDNEFVLNLNSCLSLSNAIIPTQQMHFNLVFEGLEAVEGGVAYRPWRSHTLTHGMCLQDKKKIIARNSNHKSHFIPVKSHHTWEIYRNGLMYDYISVLSAGSSLPTQINGGVGTATEGSVTLQAIWECKHFRWPCSTFKIHSVKFYMTIQTHKYLYYFLIQMTKMEPLP